MHAHHPKGRRLPALERNILKYRALEMVIILFEVENLKNFVLASVQATDRLRNPSKQRIPQGTKDQYKKAWAALVTDEILTECESNDIQRLVNYRNQIGHRVHELMFDLSREPIALQIKELEEEEPSGIATYDYRARLQIKHYRRRIFDKIGRKYHTVISFDSVLFEAAEKTYEQELRRLHRKIVRQLTTRKDEIDRLNQELLSEDADGSYPLHKKKNRTLTNRGIEICYQLFAQDKSTLAVAHLLRISYRAAARRRRAWVKARGQLGGAETAEHKNTGATKSPAAGFP